MTTTNRYELPGGIKLHIRRNPSDGVEPDTLSVVVLWKGDDLGRKRLVVHKVTYATATVRRLVKYTKQGFSSCVVVAQAILQAVAQDPAIIHPEAEYVD